MYLASHFPRRRTRVVAGFLLVALMSILLAGCGQSTDEAPFGSDDSAAPKTAAVVAAPAAKVATTAPTAVETAPPTEPPSAPATGGSGVDSAAAETLFGKRCGACHTLSSVTGAVGTIGPALDGVASRDLIAGTLEVSLDNFKTWLANPAAVKPGTAMPALGLAAEDIDVLAAWLMTLE